MVPDGILSIQSAVAYGHVGNSAAVFPLQRLGFEVWPVDTVQFSNHTGYGVWRGAIHPLEQITEVLLGVEERGVFARTRAVVSGYLGDAALGEAVLSAVERVRAARPGAVYACDPVMGDVGRGFFVRPGIPEFFRDRAVPAADLVTPNAFEAAWLAQRSIASLDEALAAAATIRAMGPDVVVITSLELEGEPDQIRVLADTAEGSWLVRTPKLPVTLNGTGDAFSALMLGHWLLRGEVARAVTFATSALYALVEATHDAGAREVLLVACQDLYAHPERLFPAERVR